MAIHFDWGVDAVKGCLKRAGYQQYIARVKPPISEKNHRLRLAWTQKHVNWTKE